MARKTHLEASGFNVVPLVPKERQKRSENTPGNVEQSPPEHAETNSTETVKNVKTITPEDPSRDTVEVEAAKAQSGSKRKREEGNSADNGEEAATATGEADAEGAGAGKGADETGKKKKKMRHKSKMVGEGKGEGKEATGGEVKGASGQSKQERDSLKRRTRREKLKERKMTCFLCRKVGHSIKFCPTAPDSAKAEALKTEEGKDGETGSALVEPSAVEGICYRCGSTEHRLSQCKKKSDSRNPLPFAQCFICNQKGHLAGQCPENERGLYPKGGGCRFCGSVRHLARDCKPAQQEAGVVTLGKIDLAQGGDDDDVFVALHKMDDEKKAKKSLKKAAGATGANTSALGPRRPVSVDAGNESVGGGGADSGAAKVVKKKKIVTF
ncbi:hypothetical protein HK104_009116 [Borealophlyctis nickersoniae]|nr:hypothetical protein HK104_009116 [Borealophlyctis nickersoniae]